MESRVNAEVRSVLAAWPDFTITPETLGAMRDFPMPPVCLEGVKLTERTIPGSEAAPDVPILVFEPAERKQKKIPGIFYIHGGGFVMGSAKDPVCVKYAQEINCVVVSAEYRLAPENPYPAALEDCYAALKWFSENAAELGVDPSKIAIAGASAGGGLCAAVALYARDHGGPSLCYQLLLSPMIDDRNITPSSHEITDRRVWNRTSNTCAWKMYLGSDNKGEVSQYAAPARATDLSGLPPTYVMVGDLDPFRDEDMDYAARLTQAGVPTEFHLYPGCFHGIEFYAPNAEISLRIVSEYMAALKRALQD